MDLLALKHKYNMLRHMRTSIDVPDGLLRAAKAAAARRGITVRSLMIQGLELALERHREGAKRTYRLPDCTVDGEGLQDGVADLHWDTLRDLVHDEATRLPRSS